MGSDWGLFECVDDAGGHWLMGLYTSSENIRSTIVFPNAWDSVRSMAIIILCRKESSIMVEGANMSDALLEWC